MATKEFEDSSDVRLLVETVMVKFVQYDEDDKYCEWAYYVDRVIFLIHLLFLQSDEEAAHNPAETEVKDPTETEPPLITEDTAASPQSTSEPEAGPQENLQETQAPSNASEPPGGTIEAVNAMSRAHLFIFDSETQEEGGSQVSSGDRLAPAGSNLQPPVKTISKVSPTQAQLEDDKQRLTELMCETNQVSDTFLLFYHLNLNYHLNDLENFIKMR